MAVLNTQLSDECRRLGMGMRDNADPIEVVQMIQRLFRLYGEQPITFDIASMYLYVIQDGMLNGRLRKKHPRREWASP